MIQADSFNGISDLRHDTPDRPTGGEPARRRLLDAEALDLRGTRAHARHQRRPPPHRRRRSRSPARAGAARRRAAPPAASAPALIVAISGRNQLRGYVDEVRVEGLLAQVRLRIGDQTLTAVITRDAVEELKLRRGDEALAIVKSTEVMIAREADAALHAAAPRQRAPAARR